MLKELDGCCEVVDVGTEGGARAMLVGCVCEGGVVGNDAVKCSIEFVEGRMSSVTGTGGVF